MYYLLVIPIGFIAAIIKLIAQRYKLNIFNKICDIVLIIVVILFAYLYALYQGVDILQILKSYLFK